MTNSYIISATSSSCGRGFPVARDWARSGADWRKKTTKNMQSAGPSPPLPSHFPPRREAVPPNPSRGLWGVLWVPSAEFTFRDSRSVAVNTSTGMATLLNNQTHISKSSTGRSPKWWTCPYSYTMKRVNNVGGGVGWDSRTLGTRTRIVNMRRRNDAVKLTTAGQFSCVITSATNIV